MMVIQLQLLLPVGEPNDEAPLQQDDEGEVMPPVAILLLQILAVETTGQEGQDDSRS